MFNILQLQQERQHKVLSCKEIIDRAEKGEGGPRPLSADETTIFDRLDNEIKALDAQISSVQEHQKRAEAAAQLVKDLETPRGRISTPEAPARPATPAAGVTFRIPATARASRSHDAFKVRAGERAEDAELRAYQAGMWLRAQCFDDVRAAHWCNQNGIVVRNAMAGGSNPDGGFLVPDVLSQEIIILREQYGVFRQNMRVWPMGSDTLDIPRRLSGITIGPIGENPAAAISQSNPQFNQVKLVAKKAGGLTLISSEIAEDAVIDLASWVAQEFAYGFALFEDQCAYLGDGTSTYLGIQGLKQIFSSSSLKGYVLCTSTHNTMALVDNADLTRCMAACPQYARPGAKWYCSSVFADLVFGRLMAVAGGNSMLTLGEGRGQAYLGYPIVISQVLETSTGTINLTPFAFFGNLRMSSSLGDRRQVSVFPSQHRFMDTDQIGIRGIERFDMVHNDLGDNNNAGPLVALIGQS